MLLKDKVVIVSGIGPGLGVKLAVEAAREGARGVMLAARSPAKLDDTKERIRALGVTCRAVKVPTDITVAAERTRLVEHTIAEFGHRRAGQLGVLPRRLRTDRADQRRLLGSGAQTNLLGSVRLTLAVAPQMKAQGGGSVVMINTLASFRPFAGEAAYAASKGGLLAATKYLAAELGPHNIRVNTARMSWMWGAPVQGYVQATAAARRARRDDHRCDRREHRAAATRHGQRVRARR